MATSNSDKRAPSVRAGGDIISAVRFSQQLTAAIDSWAVVHETVRSEAIRRLVELGLNATAAGGHPMTGHRDEQLIEAEAIKQIAGLLDPLVPADERERRIRRLVDGPPEFLAQRIDLPKHET